MSSVIFFTTSLPSPIADELTRAGYRVFEALAISEVFYLFEHENANLCIMDASMDKARANEIAARFPTLQLQPEATPRDVINELWLLKKDHTNIQ